MFNSFVQTIPGPISFDQSLLKENQSLIEVNIPFEFFSYEKNRSPYLDGSIEMDLHDTEKVIKLL